MKDQIIALGIDEETAKKVEDILKAELKDKYIPKSRFDEVNTAKAKLEDDVKARDTQLEELKKATGDTEKLNAKIQELQDLNAKNKADYEASIKGMRTDDFVKTALMEEGLVDVKYLPGVKAYLNIAELDIDNVKSVEEFKSSIAEAKAITASWFKSDEPPSKDIGGFKLNDPANKTQPGGENLDKGSYEYFLRQAGVE